METKKMQNENSNIFCDICDDNHNTNNNIFQNISKHENENARMETNGNKKNAKYFCEFCNFSCSNKSNYLKHENTKKHYINSSQNNIDIQNLQQLECEKCHKLFLNRSGLWKHSQKCYTQENLKNIEENEIEMSQFLTPELFFEFFKQSKELQNVLVEQNKELQSKLLELAHKQSIVNNNTTNSNNTTNNNQFNLQFFLNETCKDAMNITDFVNSLKITTEDFVTTGRLGYVDGISRIIINGLKDIDVEKRPIHCTDLKRETVYIKHDNTWEKEDPDKKKLKWAVNSVARLNLQQLDVWQEDNPEYKIGESTKNYEYMKYCSAALGGQYKEQDDKFAEKIMKNVLRQVVVNKRG
jgi:hypothetical protein